MCRINGILQFRSLNTGIDIANIGLKLRDELAHGGPDDSGYYISEQRNLFLGHRRLSILDTSGAGHQPMEFKCWVIVYNGEVYNFRSIRNELISLGYDFTTESDTEVILKAYDCWGKESVDKFRGMFSFALWNKTTKELILCRDRLGVKPLYYYNDDDYFIFASELDGIISFPGINLEIDQESVSRFLQVGYIKSPFSIFKKIKKVNPGCFINIDEDNHLTSSDYWSVSRIQTTDEVLSDDFVLQEANRILLESCKLRMVSDVPVGVFLSGGIDSSLVSAILSKDLHFNLKTFSIGFDQKDFDESSHAKKIAEYLGAEHHEWILTDKDFLDSLFDYYSVYDEPFGDGSGIPTFLLSKFAKESVTVALSADGGDEMFGGYDRYVIAKRVFDKIKLFPLGFRKQISKFLLNADPKKLRKLLGLVSGIKEKADLDWRLPKLFNLLSSQDLYDCYSKSHYFLPEYILKQLHLHPVENPFLEEKNLFASNNIISGFGKIDVSSYLEGDILIKVDRATMAVALEGREPLLDHHLVEFGLSLPDHFKIRDGKNKWILRTLLEQKLPKYLFDRPKKGFAPPLHKWLMTHLKNSIIEMSNNKSFHEAFLFDTKVFEGLVTQYLSGKSFVNPHFIWNLHMLYIWYQKKLKHA